MFRFGKKKRVDEEMKLDETSKNLIANFDEDAYLEANPDVQLSIENGSFKDAKHHFETFGLNEIQLGVRKLHEEEELAEENIKLSEMDIQLHEEEDLAEVIIKRSQINIQIVDESDDAQVETKLQDSEYYKEVKKILDPGIEFDDSKWQYWLKAVPESAYPHRKDKAHIEFASSSSIGKEGVVVGWIVQQTNSIIWIEDAEGNPSFFDNAYRMFRQDVYDAFYEDMIDAVSQTGFILRVKDIKPGQTLYIKSLSADGIHTIASMEVKSLESDPKKLAAWLFSIDSPLSELSSRFTGIDWPLIGDMLNEKEDSIRNMPVVVANYGDEMQNYKPVSIIIPLYGRIDFMESQMIEFAQDPYIMSHVEIIYVIDDPSLVEPLRVLSANLYNLYQIPFKTVWGSANRGFSGANNLGAEHAKGTYLIFMNSDVFPRSKGWVEALVKVLEENEEVGVVAPRLLFADGSIQHGGIEFKNRSDLGVWINHHPNMGLDPSLDPYKELTMLPAVTGACMALRREDFDAVEGWDTGYLIGDFEDTDLCLKLYREGKMSAYLPTVELTHLERQSFGLTGSGDFRTKVVILNATRHQNRWNELITELSTKEKS